MSTLLSIRTISIKVSNTVTKSSVELEAPELQKGSMRIKEKECIGYIVADVNTRDFLQRFVVVTAPNYA